MASKDQGSEDIVQEAKRQFKPVFSIGQEGFEDGSCLSHPWGVAVSERNVLGPQIAVSDTANNRVQIFGDDGSVLKVFGSQNTFKSDREGQFNFPTGIVYHDNGCITVADTYNHRVQTFSGNGDYLSWFGGEGSLDHQLQTPYGLSLDNEGNIIVTDQGNKAIKIFSPSGKFLRKLGGDGCLEAPAHCVQQGQHYIVSDFQHHCMKIFDWQGNYLYKFGKKGERVGEFASPRCLSVYQDGKLVVCDSENHRVQFFDKSGEFLTKFGTNGSDLGQFYYAVSTAIFKDGRIAVTDMYNSRVQIFA